MEYGKGKFKYQNGQTLVLLLVFIVMIISITTAAAFIIATNSLAASNVELGLATKEMAESGVEKALLSLLRNPSYTGETLSVDTGTVTIVVTGSGSVTIDSTAVNGNFTKKVEVAATYSNNELTINSWKEIN
jgi:hypothetical protein